MRTKKSLTREQRQVRRLPLLITAVVAFIYGTIHLNTGSPLMYSSLILDMDCQAVSRYLDLPFIYLALVIFIMILQKNKDQEVSILLFINIILVGVAAILAWLLTFSFLMALVIFLGVAWGVAYRNMNEIGLNILLFFLIATSVIGSICAFVASVIILLIIGIIALFKMFVGARSCDSFLDWLGLKKTD